MDKRAERGELTRGRILDAAELLFAERGYHGVSLRDITALADVETALASYHFGTKDKLFSAVIARRADEHRLDLIDSLAAAHAEAAPAVPSNRALVRAYALPGVEKIGRGPGWAAYTKLAVMLQNLPANDEASGLGKALFDETIKLFVDAFLAANPMLQREQVINAVYFLHGALIHLLSQGQGLEWVDPAFAERDRVALVDDLAAFFDAGFAGMAASRL
ncbi:MAG: TetR family transcriptional regulator [Novosphingobium sp.]